MSPSSIALRLLLTVTAVAAVGWAIGRWSRPDAGGSQDPLSCPEADSCLPVPAVAGLARVPTKQPEDPAPQELSPSTDGQRESRLATSDTGTLPKPP
jgi:hypothetical protein